MNKWGELLITLLLLVLGATLIIYFWKQVLVVLAGSVGIFFLLFGVLFLLITIEDFKY